MKKGLKTFTVYANVSVNCGVDIDAESLQDAVSKANELNVTDFVGILGDYQGGILKITGILSIKGN